MVDAEMPEMDGYVLTKNIKADSRFKGPRHHAFLAVVQKPNKGDGKAVGSMAMSPSSMPKFSRIPCVRCWKIMGNWVDACLIENEVSCGR